MAAAEGGCDGHSELQIDPVNAGNALPGRAESVQPQLCAPGLRKLESPDWYTVFP